MKGNTRPALHSPLACVPGHSGAEMSCRAEPDLTLCLISISKLCCMVLQQALPGLQPHRSWILITTMFSTALLPPRAVLALRGKHEQGVSSVEKSVPLRRLYCWLRHTSRGTEELLRCSLVWLGVSEGLGRERGCLFCGAVT